MFLTIRVYFIQIFLIPKKTFICVIHEALDFHPLHILQYTLSKKIIFSQLYIFCMHNKDKLLYGSNIHKTIIYLVCDLYVYLLVGWS